MSAWSFRKTVKPEHRQSREPVKRIRKPRAEQTPRVFRKEKLPVGVRRENERLELCRQLKEAREQLIYWKHKKVMETLPMERAKYGARLLAWTMTAAALAARLEAHNGRAVA